MVLGLTELLESDDSDVLPRLPRLVKRFRAIMNDISGTALKVGSSQMMDILDRLQFTTKRALDLPCCLNVADSDYYRRWLPTGAKNQLVYITVQYSCELLL